MVGNPFASAAIGLLASALSLWMSIPQAARIWRDRSYTGVSRLTWVLFCLTFSQWVGYTWREGIWVAFAGNLIALLTASTILLGIHRCDPRPRDGRRGGLLLLACIAAVVLGHNAPPVVVVIAQFAAIGVRVPQVVASHRTWRRRTPSEVSRTAWWISLASAACWTLYGVVLPDLAITLVSPSVMVVSALVLAFEYLALRARSGRPAV